MAKIVFGNHSSVLVPNQDRDNIRKVYCDVLGAKFTKSDSQRDFIRLGDNYVAFLYGDVADASDFQRTTRSGWRSNPTMWTKRAKELSLQLRR